MSRQPGARMLGFRAGRGRGRGREASRRELGAAPATVRSSSSPGAAAPAEPRRAQGARLPLVGLLIVCALAPAWARAPTNEAANATGHQVGPAEAPDSAPAELLAIGGTAWLPDHGRPAAERHHHKAAPPRAALDSPGGRLVDRIAWPLQDAPQDTRQDALQGAPQDAPQDARQEGAPQDAPQDTRQDALQGAPQDAPQDARQEGAPQDRAPRPAAAAGPSNKLDYIVEFMRANKLAKFCSLLTSQAPEVRNLSAHLNSLAHFTLFVPTDEALLLWGPASEQLASGAQLAQFLMGHASDQLVLPRLDFGGPGGPATGAPVLYRSLAGTSLRVATVAVELRVAAPSGAGRHLAAPASRLELIVNGANVLGGHSHALQEPNNSSATYAIVHLIDRPLYPVAGSSLGALIGRLAPRMAKYIELADDRQLASRLEPPGAERLLSGFVPSDEAFQATPSKLIEQLDTNRTFLKHFVRAHFVDGLFFGGQLGELASDAGATQRPLQLTSLAGQRLDFRAKRLAGRQLILVNSIPVQESDLVAHNGVAHLLSRPIFERHLLEACNCAPQAAADQRRPVNWFGSAPGEPVELEREESASQLQRVSGASSPASGAPASLALIRDAKQGLASGPAGPTTPTRGRAQRSDGQLVSRNNRDFYRPLAAPANLQLEQPQPQPAPAPLGAHSAANATLANQGRRAETSAPAAAASSVSAPISWPNQAAGSGEPLAADLAGPLFEVQRYKVVLNATSRQRLREQQLRAGPSSAPASVAAPSDKFAYDQPLQPRRPDAGQTNRWAHKQRLEYAPAASNRSEPSGAANQSAGAPARPMLKFEPDDALIMRQPAASSTTWLARLRAGGSSDGLAGANSSSGWPLGAQPASGQHQALAWSASAPSKVSVGGGGGGPSGPSGQLAQAAKSQPGLGFGGCAFHDSECKRIVGRLSQLPSLGAGPQKSSKWPAPAASNGRAQPHLDSTFGESTEGPSVAAAPASGRLVQQPQPRLQSISNETSPAEPNSSRRPQASDPAVVGSALIGDIARISRPPSSGRLQQQQPEAPPSVLLVPVRLFQETGIALPASGDSVSASGQSTAAAASLAPNNNNTGGWPENQQRPSSQVSSRQTIYFGSAPPLAGATGQQASHVSTSFGSGAPIRTNLTPFEQPALFELESVAPAVRQHPAAAHLANLTRQRLPISGAGLKSPVRVLAESGQIKSAQPTEEALGSIKEARKMFRLERQQLTKQRGDISTTFAKLSAASGTASQPPPPPPPPTPPTPPTQQSQLRAHNKRPSNYTFTGLATQASNQEASGANFVRSLAASNQQLVRPLDSQLNDNQLVANSAADFFQNRTIVEIMDDSGLRIDGQQVTFGRLKDCLAQAGLLNVVAQPDSGLTMFMPTDLAFQRLVQQQAVEHQRARATRSSFSSTGRLISAPMDTRRHLVPLIAKGPAGAAAPAGASNTTSAHERPIATRDLGLATGSLLASANERLTLDCSSQQVRQLLLDHLSARLITPRQLVSDLGLGSLSGRRLLLSSVPSKKIVVVDGQPVVAATRAKNGMVYVVNKFLDLSQQAASVVQLIESQPNLTTFLSYLSFSSLADRLRRETGPITILAPTNEAFEQLSATARQLINSDPSALADILRGHVVEGAQFGKLMSLRNRLKTMNADQTIEVRVVKPNVYQLDQQLTSIKLIGTAANGVLNTIDRLIVPAWLRVSMGSRPALGPGLEPASPSWRAADLGGELGGPSAEALGWLRSAPPLVSFGRPLDSSRRLIAPASNSLADSGFDDPSSATTTTTKSPAIGWAARQDQRSSPFLRLADELRGAQANGSGLDARQGPAGPAGLEAGPASSASSASPTSPPSLAPPADELESASRRHQHLNDGRSLSKNMRLIVKLARLMNTNKFVDYLLRSRLNESLKADTNYVLLVPTDQAVAKLPRQITELLERDPERLQDLVNYHVLDTTFEFINTIPDGQTLNSVNEKDILFNWHRNNSILTASGALVLRGVQEDNIALLIVDRVLYPTPGDLLSIVSKSPILSNLSALIRNAKLANQLSLAGPYTLFAPSDVAFKQLKPDDLRHLQVDAEAARKFLLRHLSSPALFTSAIALAESAANASSSPSLTISNSLGEELTLRQRNDYFSVNEVNFSYADVAATNGVIHVIDGLL